ncbi:Uncharacterized protein Rs2_35771 [Raphanus sativus]|nr:Uncharacterized protein Rs2_35771 [Raphanus sativus]
MEELHEVTRQYLRCPDHVEAVARRQRVHFNDANGLMEATAASILVSQLAAQPRFTLTSVDMNNPAASPSLQDLTLQDLLHARLLVLYNPPRSKAEDIGLDPYYSNVSPLLRKPQEQEDVRPACLRSAIFSPQSGRIEIPVALRTPEEL